MLTVGILFAGVRPTQALPLNAGDVVRLADGPGTTGGGEFLMTVNSVWSFVTFCLQRTEYIDFTHQFKVDSVSTYTLTDPIANGGNALGQDFISSQTAFLYTMFRQGTLAGYAYTGSGHVNSANLLQNAIWMFEQELAMNLSNPFVLLANNAVNGGLWSGIGNVRVLNLSRNGIRRRISWRSRKFPNPRPSFSSDVVSRWPRCVVAVALPNARHPHSQQAPPAWFPRRNCTYRSMNRRVCRRGEERKARSRF